jgi:predicted DNA-binding transcriptional regulator AlpA
MAGLISYFKIGMAVRFRKSELDATLERMRVG